MVRRLNPGTEIRAIREGLKLTQRQFADRFNFNLGTLQQWEQGRRSPDNSARTLLMVILHSPDVVETALRHCRTF